jgi:hypothetical protein
MSHTQKKPRLERAGLKNRGGFCEGVEFLGFGLFGCIVPPNFPESTEKKRKNAPRIA